MISEYQNISILLIEDEDFDVRRVKNTLKPFLDRITITDIVADGGSALSLIQKQPDVYDVVIMDYQIAGGISGEDLIKAIKRHAPCLQIIVITKMTINITDFSFANRLIEAGAMWYCTKYPGDIEEYIYQPTDFILNIFNAMQKNRLEKEKIDSERNLDQKISDILQEKVIIGNSTQAILLKEVITKVSKHDTPVLISGESGTGKELVANHIHYLSDRKNKKLVTINCGSIPSQLIESELFGYEKGAFTGANKNKAGLFEIADQGSVFLDEVSELPLEAQVKLLRFLQNGEIDKIGRTQKIKVDVRIIAATNKNLQEQINKKAFREDLFYRLNVATVRVPELKERGEDLTLLTNYFLEKFSSQMNISKPEITPQTFDLLGKYDWPGNVRQLQNVVQRFLLSGQPVIDEGSLPDFLGISTTPAADSSFDINSFQTMNEVLTLRQMEKEFRLKYFEFVRSKTNSDAEAARKLGLAPPNYYRMCKELGLK